MSQAPAVLALHFLLEVAALAALGYWGWATHAGAIQWLWAVGLPLAAAVAWAVLRARGDGPDPLVAVPGAARLLLELVVLGGAAAALLAARRAGLAVAMAALVVVDYAASYDRVLELLRL